jgi:hypothetical protein
MVTPPPPGPVAPRQPQPVAFDPFASPTSDTETPPADLGSFRAELFQPEPPPAEPFEPDALAPELAEPEPPAPPEVRPPFVVPDVFGAEMPGVGSGRRLGRVVVSAALVVALTVGAFVFMSGRRGGGGTALALSFTDGQHLQYHAVMSIDGKATFQGQTEPVSGTITMDLGWTVKSVDANGVATVKMKVSHVGGTMAGQTLPSQHAVTMTLRVARDGRVLSGGDLGVVGDATGPEGGFPGSSQLTPILPDGLVKPGDTWTKSYQQANPLGSGALHYSTHGTLLNYESDGADRTAVIETTASVPFDMTIDFSKLASLAGKAVPKGASMAYKGSMDMRATSWVDTVTKQLVKASLSATFAFKMTFHGLQPDVPDGSTISFDGTMRLDLTQPVS